VPFRCGEVNLFRFFYRNGKVLSSRASAQYFADLNHIAGAPETNNQDGRRSSHRAAARRNDSNVEVELVPFTAVDTVSLSHTGAVRDCWARRARKPNGPAVSTGPSSSDSEDSGPSRRTHNRCPTSRRTG